MGMLMKNAHHQDKRSGDGEALGDAGGEQHPRVSGEPADQGADAQQCHAGDEKPFTWCHGRWPIYRLTDPVIEPGTHNLSTGSGKVAATIWWASRVSVFPAPRRFLASTPGASATG
jgi:hypothetical protein